MNQSSMPVKAASIKWATVDVVRKKFKDQTQTSHDQPHAYVAAWYQSCELIKAYHRVICLQHTPWLQARLEKVRHICVGELRLCYDARPYLLQPLLDIVAQMTMRNLVCVPEHEQQHRTPLLGTWWKELQVHLTAAHHGNSVCLTFQRMRHGV